VDGSPRSDEAHQEGVRRRLLYIHEEMTIYCNSPIVSRKVFQSKGIAKTKRIAYQDFKKINWFGRKSGESKKF